MRITISIDDESFDLNDPEMVLSFTVDEDVTLRVIIQTYVFPVVGLLSTIVVGIAVQRIYSKRKRSAFLEALAVKQRFDDINNILGVIVLHRSSGLPVYSRMLKDGFEEGMISAFVTAITHFRAEFDQNGTQPELKIIPISDIINSVSTKNLLCAVFTLSKGSPESEMRLIEFARSAGMLFDEVYEETPTEFRKDSVDNSFNHLFNRHLDGALSGEYKMDSSKDVPREFRKLADAASIISVEGVFRLSPLILSLTSEDVHEVFAHKKVYTALSEKLLIYVSEDEIENADDDGFVPPSTDDERLSEEQFQSFFSDEAETTDDDPSSDLDEVIDSED